MQDSAVLRWLLACLALLTFIMPVLLADELSLQVNWLLLFLSWFLLIFITAVLSRLKKTKTPPPEN